MKKITEDTLKLGNANVTGDVVIETKNGHLLRSNQAEGVWEFSNDNGASWQAIGSGSGGGLDVFHTQDFEQLEAADVTTGNNATYRTAGSFGGTMSDETSTMINGESSLKYTAGASSTNDWFEIETIDLPLKARDLDVGLNFWIDLTNFSQDVTLVVWDVTNSAILNNDGLGDTITGGQARSRVAVSFYIPSSCAQIAYGFHMKDAPVNTEHFKVDDFEFSTNPFSFKELGEEQQVRLDTVNGYGSTATRIRRWTNSTISGDNILAYADSATGGGTITALKDCYVVIGYTDNFDGATSGFGISKNASSLTADFGTLAVGERFSGSGAVPSANTPDNLMACGRLAAGDVIRAHTSAQNTGVANRSILNVVAFAKADHVVTPASIEVQYYETDTHAGYGSVGTQIAYFTNVTRNEGDPLLSIVNNSTDGLTFTALKDCEFSMEFTFITAAAETFFGPTVDANPTTSISSLAASFVKDMGVTKAANRQGHAAWTGKLLRGQVVRAHTNTGAVSANAAFAHVSVVARTGSLYLAAVPVQKVAYLKDQKAANTAGGSSSTGSWLVRDLTVSEGATEIVSLSANSFTLQPGTYEIYATVPGHQSGRHKAKLRNTTDSTDAIIGSSEMSSTVAAEQTNSTIAGVITISSAKTFQIQHQVGNALATEGLGRASNYGVVEIYTQVKITKLA